MNCTAALELHLELKIYSHFSEFTEIQLNLTEVTALNTKTNWTYN